MEVEELNPKDKAKLSSTGKKYFKFIEFDKDEELICEIRKHSIGLFFIYFTGISIAVVISVLFGIISLSESVGYGIEDMGFSATSLQAITTLFGLFFVIFIVIAMTIQGMLYVNNVIFVTSEKIAQVLYINLFHRKISQLSIGDVQDVTVTQKGVMAHFFNYGVLVIETAGEQENYKFSYIPDPYKHAKMIVGAHERNLVKFGN